MCCVVPGRLTTEIVRSLEPGAVAGRRRWRHRGDHVRALVVHRAPVRGRRLPPPGRAARRTVTAVGLVVPAGGAPGGAGRQQGRVPADPHRRAAVGRGRGPPAGRHRLLPAGRVRPPGVVDARRRPEGARAVAGAAARSSGSCRRRGEITVRSRRAGCDLRGRLARGSPPASSKGEFPNYRQLIPASYPNHVTVGREPLLDASAPGPGHGRGRHRQSGSPSRATRCGSTPSTRTRARPTPSSRPSSRAPRSPWPSTRSTWPTGSRRRSVTRSCSTPSTPSSRRSCARSVRRTTSTCSCPSGCP